MYQDYFAQDAIDCAKRYVTLCKRYMMPLTPKSHQLLHLVHRTAGETETTKQIRKQHIQKTKKQTQTINYSGKCNIKQ